jgi:DNA-binding HxlR family transcriptional regulator
VHEGAAEELQLRHHSQWTPLARALSATGDRWTLLIALALAHGSQRPVQLRDRLAGISSGVLDRQLQQMVTLGLLLRRRFKEMPPRVEVALTETGRELLPIAGALTRWGATHMWSAPQAHERVDVEALLGLLPVLLENAQLPNGTLELAVAVRERRTAWRFAIERGHLNACEVNGSKAHASAEGNASGWVAALGPQRDYAGLRISGRKTLARSVLDALPAASTTG